MGLISNGTTIFDAGALDSGLAKGAVTFIKKLTASSSSTLSFVDGSANVVLDGTYKEYLFTFNNLHPSENAHANFTMNFSIDAGSNYNATQTTTYLLNIYLPPGSRSPLLAATAAGAAITAGVDSCSRRMTHRASSSRPPPRLRLRPRRLYGDGLRQESINTCVDCRWKC